MPTIIARQAFHTNKQAKIVLPSGYDRRIIGHFDLNYFYANLAEMMEPQLKGKPMVVHGDQSQRHGIILTANNPAKRCGIRVGMPLWKAKQLCRDLIFRQVDFKVVDLYSNMVKQVYDQFTDRRQDFGIDESWLDFTGIAKNMDEAAGLARHIMYLVEKMFGITVSVGLSHSRILAKLGSDYKATGQKIKTPSTLCVMGPDNWREVAWPLDVGELLFIGSARTKALKEVLSIKTIGDLARTDESILRKHFGVVGTAMWGNANGLDISDVGGPDDVKEPEKSFSNSFTSYRDLVTPEDVWFMTLMMAETVGPRMRRAGFVGNTIECHWRYADDLHSDGHQKKLRYSTNVDLDIAKEAFGIYTTWTHTFRPIRKVTVRMTGLDEAGAVQQLSFDIDAVRNAKKEWLDEAKDTVREKYGTDSLNPAIFLKDRQLAGLRHAATYGKKMFYDY